MLKTSRLYNIIMLIGMIICLILTQFDMLKIALVILQMILIVIALSGFHHHFISINTIDKYNDGALDETDFHRLLTAGFDSERILFARVLAQYYEHRTSNLHSITRDYAVSVNFNQNDPVLKVLQENNRTEINKQLALDISKSGEDHSINSPQKIVDKAEDMMILFGKDFVVSTFSPSVLNKVLKSGFYPEYLEAEAKKDILNLIESISKCEFKFSNTSQFLTKELYNFLLKKENPVEEPVSS